MARIPGTDIDYINYKRIDGSVAGHASWYGFYTDCYEHEQNISTNKSKVTTIAYILQKTGYTFDTISNNNHYINIDGQRQDFNSRVIVNVEKGNAVEICRSTKEIEHTSDGSKIANIKTVVSEGVAVGGYNTGQCTAEGSFTLSTIPRASKLNNISNFTIEDGVQVTATKYYSGFTDALEIKLGSTLVKTINNFVSSKVTFTTDELNSIYNLTKTSNTASFSFILTTKNGANIIGTDTKTSTGTISTTDRSPTFSNFAYVDINSITTALTGNNQKLIKKYSNIQVTISSSNKATGNKGASIIKYRLECGALSAEAAYADTVVLKLDNVESGSVVVKAIDSRQNSAAVTKTATIINYTSPVLSKLEMLRDGGTSTICMINAAGTYNNVNFGAALNTVAKIEYKKNTGAWTDCTNLFTIAEGGINTISSAKIAGFTVGTQYIVYLRITDKLSISNIKQVEISSGDSTLVLNTSKKLAGFGKIPDKTLPKRKCRCIK